VTPGLDILVGTALGIGVLHTLIGIDHSLPFVALAQARAWSWRRTMAITFACGLGHVLSSVLIGSFGIAVGVALDRLIWIEGVRGHLASYLTIGFGLVYAARALWKRRASHVHRPAGHSVQARSEVTAWWLFIVFVLGPCEALIPMLMVPAASRDWLAVWLLCVAFGAATLLTMAATVTAGYFGLARVRWPRLAPYADVLAGIAIATSGAAIELLGI
jgi:nickel/cobalt exporter